MTKNKFARFSHNMVEKNDQKQICKFLYGIYIHFHRIVCLAFHWGRIVYMAYISIGVELCIWHIFPLGLELLNLTLPMLRLLLSKAQGRKDF